MANGSSSQQGGMNCVLWRRIRNLCGCEPLGASRWFFVIPPDRLALYRHARWHAHLAALLGGSLALPSDSDAARVVVARRRNCGGTSSSRLECPPARPSRFTHAA